MEESLSFLSQPNTPPDTPVGIPGPVMIEESQFLVEDSQVPEPRPVMIEESQVLVEESQVLFPDTRQEEDSPQQFSLCCTISRRPYNLEICINTFLKATVDPEGCSFGLHVFDPDVHRLHIQQSL